MIFLGCTFRWLSTTETCLILERFSASVFVGDDVARSIYLALNMLLWEDLALGDVEGWNMNERIERFVCGDGQFLDA